MSEYTQQEVRDFYNKMHESKDGCYSFHVPTWEKMCREHTNFVCELAIERNRNLIEERYHIEPTLPWPNTPKEQQYFDKICKLQGKVDKFPWGVGLGFSIGSLFWGIMFALFGGN